MVAPAGPAIAAAIHSELLGAGPRMPRNLICNRTEPSVDGLAEEYADQREAVDGPPTLSVLSHSAPQDRTVSQSCGKRRKVRNQLGASFSMAAYGEAL
jgi:hypothetical protein